MKIFLALGLIPIFYGKSAIAAQITKDEPLEFKGAWETPSYRSKKWGEPKIALPMNGVKIIIEDTGEGEKKNFQGYLIGGKYSFLAPRDGYTFNVRLEASFPGVDSNGSLKPSGGDGAFELKNGTLTGDGTTVGVTHSINLGQVLEYTAKETSNEDAKLDDGVQREGEFWAIFHAMADMSREARRQLDVPVQPFRVVFPAHATNFNSSNLIRIKRVDRFDWDVVSHEFGHLIGKQTNAENPDANPGEAHSGANQYDNDGNKENALGLAYSEGFGTWFGASLLERSSYRGLVSNVGDGKYTDTEDSDYDFSLEALDAKYPYYGDDAEFAISRIFWDLTDTTQDSNTRTLSEVGAKGLKDRTSLGLDDIWKFFSGSNASSISDFYKKSFASSESIKSYLPSPGTPVSSSQPLADAIAAGDTFAEFGVAPVLFSPEKGSKLNLAPVDGDPMPLFKWDQLATGKTDNLKLNKFNLALYSGDLKTLLYKKENIEGLSYQFTQADLDALKASVEALRSAGTPSATAIAVIFGSSDKLYPPTGPYLSNGQELLLQDYNRAMVAVVDSSGSNTQTDPTNQRIVASKESLRRLISLAEAAADSTKVPDIAAAVDFDSSVTVLSGFSDPDTVIPTLSLIDSSGGTDIAAGINTAVNLLDDINNSGSGFLGIFTGRSSILVFTDGMNGNGDGPVIEAIVRATAKGYRVHYGFLSPLVSSILRTPSTPVGGPGESALSPRQQLAMSDTGTMPSTIEQAVLASGGVYSQIGDAQSQVAFIDQVFARGLTNSDGDNTTGGLIVGQANTADELNDDHDLKSYTFSGRQDEQVSVRVETVNFRPNVTLFDRDGNILVVDADEDGDGRVLIPQKLPYTGEYTVQVFSEDGRLGLFDIFVDVQNAGNETPVIETTGDLVLNRQSGYFEQIVTVRNSTSETVNSFEIDVANLPTGSFVANAPSGTASVSVQVTLAPGETIQVVLEYFSPTRVAFTPTLSIASGSTQTPPTFTSQTSVSGFMAADGAFVIEFTSVPGQLYYVQYSDDMKTWQTVLPPVEARGTKVQWIDSGPPKTSKHPREVTSRVYRIAQP